MKAIRGQIIIRMNVRQKEWYCLAEGVVIEWQRTYNFNLREDRASYGYAVDGGNVPRGASVLCHHLSTEPSYLIENDTILTEKERKEGFRIFSIPVDMCFTYDNGDGWIPCKDFLITQRVYAPYKGRLEGIGNQLVKNRMFVISGMDEWGEIDLSGKCVVSLENCDYQIIFHKEDNKEYNLIRSRSREIIAVDEQLTKDLKKGRYLVGLSPTDCKTLN